MCLDAVDTKPTTRKRVGYKVFIQEDDGSIRGLFHGPLEGWETGKWIKDKMIAQLSSLHSTSTYPTGFHVFCNYRDAKLLAGDNPNHIVRKVRVRKIVASGSQGIRVRPRCYTDVPIVVCCEILIEGESL